MNVKVRLSKRPKFEIVKKDNKTNYFVMPIGNGQGFGSAFFCGSGQKSSCGSGSWGYPEEGAGGKGKKGFFFFEFFSRFR